MTGAVTGDNDGDLAPPPRPEPLSIHLLGRPRVLLGRAERPAPRGRKAWALLGYLIATESAPSREWLAELLFADADHPLNALSWSLTQLRRLLGDGVAIGGDPVQLRLPPGTFVDVRALRSGTWVQALDLPDLGWQFLDGITLASCPAFEVWLLAERRHLSGVASDVLREAARAQLAAGEARRAIHLASRLVATNPLDEDAQELLIRSYAKAGDRAAAQQQRDACVALFRRELGVSPGAAVLAAADPEPGPSARPTTTATITARLEAGLAALDAGAIEAAIASLRQASADSHDVGDPHLRARSLLALGAALVRGVRGHDGEGAEILHEAVTAAERAADRGLAAQAHRELGYVELLRGRYDRSQRWIRTAVALATEAGDDTELAWSRAIHGLALSDVGRHTDGQRELREALRLARRAGVGEAEAWALTFLGRSHLLRRELAEARVALQEALRVAQRTRWTAFVPLPESLLAEVDLLEGRVDAAADAFEHAFALAVQLGDPCWEGFSARGIGLVCERRGDAEGALRWISEARSRCTRLPDAWLWIEGYCLDALCQLGITHGRPETATWIAELEALATRTGMRELSARAYLHRGGSGDRRASEAFRVLAAEVDNPAILAEPALVE